MREAGKRVRKQIIGWCSVGSVVFFGNCWRGGDEKNIYVNEMDRNGMNARMRARIYTMINIFLRTSGGVRTLGVIVMILMMMMMMI